MKKREEKLGVTIKKQEKILFGIGKHLNSSLNSFATQFGRRFAN
jgi:hypothetical protein